MRQVFFLLKNSRELAKLFGYTLDSRGNVVFPINL